MIQFSQNTTGIKRGSRWVVAEVSSKDILIKDPVSGKQTELPQGRSTCFDVLESSALRLSKGDKVKITRNSFDASGKRMDNGQTLDVLGVKKDGRIALQNAGSKQLYHIDRAFGHIDHAHCITSYAAQGKTVDQVLVAQTEATFSATNAKQFYVSVSRARQGVTIYTDDKKQLLSHASRDGDRTSALELSAMQQHMDATDRILRKDMSEPVKTPIPAKDRSEPLITPSLNYRDYEPEL